MSTQYEVTGERLARIETSLQHQEKKLDEINNKIDEFIEHSDNKYARKDDVTLIRNVVWALLGTFGTAIIGVIVKLIFFP
jgi:hypothetical protein